jgi:hypothetical protein
MSDHLLGQALPWVVVPLGLANISWVEDLERKYIVDVRQFRWYLQLIRDFSFAAEDLERTNVSWS